MTSLRTPPGGRDRRAAFHPAPPGKHRLSGEHRVAVVGGGIAGLAAATVLAERGAQVTVFEGTGRLGGRVSSWPLADGRTMSRGFHAFFRQYYNLRALLMRTDPGLDHLVPVGDYPLQRSDGLRDSFSAIPRTPPWSVLGFVAKSPAFTLRSLLGVNLSAATELLRVRFPETYEAYDGESAAAFLDRLRFPQAARDLALEVFARSFFADPRQFAAGELIAMFHTYFIGSAEGLIFDVPDDDYQTALWDPLGAFLRSLGTEVRTSSPVLSVTVSDAGATITTSEDAPSFDAAVIASDPGSARRLAAGLANDKLSGWRREVAATGNSPPFVVVRLWLDRPVADDRPPFLATSGYELLDNVSVLERFENGAAQWAAQRHGSVVELHAYACDPTIVADPAGAAAVVAAMEEQLHSVFPETGHSGVLHREVLVRDDCPLFGPSGWSRRPGVRTPHPRLMLAGDWVRCDYPVALMERAATTGYLAANALLAGWGVKGQDIWTAPMSGLLARRSTGKHQE